MTVKQILIIDDDHLIQESTKICLETLTNWKVTTASSGTEGLATAEIEQPDVILLDLMMPEMDGVATLQKLQANPLIQQIPVILLTAAVQSDDSRRYQKLGFKGAIAKPFQPLDLANEIAQLLGWSL